MWLIPLKDGMMSAGCVCWPDYMKSRDKPLNEFLQQTLFLLPEVAVRFKQAKLAGDAQATGNYSYSSSQMTGDGYLMIGDAYAFVDPVFSSGVYLAMQSAVRGADYIDTVLKDPSQQTRLAATLQQATQKEISAFCWFIYRFNSPTLHKLLMLSDEKNLHPIKQKMKSAVISVLAGDAGNPQIKFYLGLFKGLYYFSIFVDFKRHWRFMKFQSRQNKVQVDVH
jgi:2-polyprenyl-6-methoxyphenol hydroxylase-like FAD-dependent oxidoreductase